MMSSNPDPTLHPEDAAALDRLVEAEFELEAVEPADQEARLTRVAAVLAQLEALPAEAPSEGLTERTLARIQQAIDAEERDRRVVTTDRGWWAGTMRNLGAMAAIVAIGLLAIWPTLNNRMGGPTATEPFPGSITAGSGLSGLFAEAEELTPAESPAPVVELEGLQGYTGPVTIEPRWMERQVVQPNGEVVRVWQPVLVVVPLDPEQRSNQD